MTDYYNLLNIAKNATPDEVKEAYRKLAIRFHPDKNMDKSPEDRRIIEENFKKINEANAVLSNTDKRKAYDAYGQEEFAKKYSQEDIFRGYDYNGIFVDLFSNINIYTTTLGDSEEAKIIRAKAALNAIVDGGILLFMYLFRDKEEK